MQELKDELKRLLTPELDAAMAEAYRLGFAAGVRAEREAALTWLDGGSISYTEYRGFKLRPLPEVPT